MSSIWLHEPGSKAPRKLEGHLNPIAARAMLQTRAVKIAKANGCVIVPDEDGKKSEVEVHFEYPDGVIFTLFVEDLSPPSRPERGQPKIKDGKGLVLLADKSTINLKVPE